MIIGFVCPLPHTGSVSPQYRTICSAKRSGRKAVEKARSGGGGGGFGRGPGCACGSGIKYGDCCGAIHNKERKALRAVDLMRARYVAYHDGLVDFLMETTTEVPGENEAEFRSAVKTYLEVTEFKGLKILKTELGNPGDAEGYVKFQIQTKSESYTERSHFLPSDRFGWIYHYEKND